MLHALAIQPIQQFSYTTGKNATDSALIIDAMDVLHSGSVDGFCVGEATATSPALPPASAKRGWWCMALASARPAQVHLHVRRKVGAQKG